MLQQTLHRFKSEDIQDARLDNSGLVYIKAIFNVFRRRWVSFLAVFVCVMAVAILISVRATPQFTATASLIIDPRQKDVSGIESILSGLPPDSATIDTEVEIIKSRSLSAKIAKKFDLIADPEFNPELRAPSTFEAFHASIKDQFSGLKPEQFQSLDIEDIAQFTNEIVIQNLTESLHVQRKGLTYVINISFQSDSATKSALLANAYAEQYLVEQLEAKFDATSLANNWLYERLTVLRKEVRDAESAVELYKSRSGLLSAEGSSLTEQQISELTAQLVIQRADFEEAKARLVSVRRKIQQGNAADTVSEVLSSDVFRELRSQQAEVTRRRAELSSRYGARHPEIIKVQREAEDIAAQIQQETGRIIASLNSEVDVTRSKVTSIERSLITLREELVRNNQSLVKLRELERNADASRKLYESFLGRFKETGEQDSITEADARIVSHAAIPIEPSSPIMLLNLILGLVFGSAAGIVAISVQEAFDSGFTTGHQIEKYLGVPFIASVPKLNLGGLGKLKQIVGQRISPQDYLVEKPLSTYTEAFRKLRSAITLSDLDETPKIITITSPLPGDGKSSATYSLGRLSAMSGSKTLIIDCDLRRRSLSNALDYPPEEGLVEYLTGHSDLGAVIIQDELTDCDILPLSRSEVSINDLFGSDKFSDLLSTLRDTYDMIILDSAPILPVAETRTLAHKSDATVLVAKWRTTNRDAVKTTLSILADLNTNLVGVLLNHVDFKARRRFGYGDDGYYYGSYEKYYTD